MYATTSLYYLIPKGAFVFALVHAKTKCNLQKLFHNVHSRIIYILVEGLTWNFSKEFQFVIIFSSQNKSFCTKIQDFLRNVLYLPKDDSSLNNVTSESWNISYFILKLVFCHTIRRCCHRYIYIKLFIVTFTIESYRFMVSHCWIWFIKIIPLRFLNQTFLNWIVHEVPSIYDGWCFPCQQMIDNEIATLSLKHNKS